MRTRSNCRTSSADARPNSSKRSARPPSRLACVRRTRHALEPHKAKTRWRFSISQCTSSSRPGTFCTSSMTTSEDGDAPCISSRRSAGRCVKRMRASVSSRSIQCACGYSLWSKVLLPVCLGPHRKSEVVGRRGSTIRRGSITSVQHEYMDRRYCAGDGTAIGLARPRSFYALGLSATAERPLKEW